MNSIPTLKIGDSANHPEIKPMLKALADVYVDHVVKPSLQRAVAMPDEEFFFDPSLYIHFQMCLKHVIAVVQEAIDFELEEV